MGLSRCLIGGMKHKTRRPILRTLRVVVFREGDWFCAQAIEFDLAVQAKSLPTLYQRFHRLVTSHVAVRHMHAREPFKDLPPAPSKYREMWEAGVSMPPQIYNFPQIRRPVVIPPPDFRVTVAGS
jgi:hypothetical protein